MYYILHEEKIIERNKQTAPRKLKIAQNWGLIAMGMGQIKQNNDKKNNSPATERKWHVIFITSKKSQKFKMSSRLVII